MNISIYLKEPLLSKARIRSKSEGISLSKFIQRAVEKECGPGIPGMPMNKLLSNKGLVSLGGDALTDTEEYYV